MLNFSEISLFVFGLVLISFSCNAADKIPFPREATYCALKELGMAPLNNRQVMSVKTFGARGDGVNDDTEALKKALEEVLPGGVLDFPEGTYLHSKSLVLSKDGVVLRGKGGVLQATNQDDQALILEGSRLGVVGLVLKGVGDKRSTKPRTTKILLKGQWNQIVGVSINGGASAGILVFGARDFRISGNRIAGTLADGIHITHGSRNGLVEKNTVYRTGDDMIAVVSYGKEYGQTMPEQYLVENIIIRDNEGASNTGGRGLSVVGGKDVSIVNNKISDVWQAAGIVIAQESAYNTDGVRNILVKKNIIRGIEKSLPEGRTHFTHHAAIDLNSSNQHTVERIRIEENDIDDAGFAGIRVLGNICKVEITNNRMSRVLAHNDSKQPLQIVNNPCAPQNVVCEGNKADGVKISNDRCLAGGDQSKASDITGATLTETYEWMKCP